MLVNAEEPRSSSPTAMPAALPEAKHLVELAEVPAVPESSIPAAGSTCPTRHPLNQSTRGRSSHRNRRTSSSGLEMSDFLGPWLNSYRESGPPQLPVNRQGGAARTVQASANRRSLHEIETFQDFQRFRRCRPCNRGPTRESHDTGADRSRVRRTGQTANRRRPTRARGKKTYRQPSRRLRAGPASTPTYGWDASPISTARLLHGRLWAPDQGTRTGSWCRRPASVS